MADSSNVTIREIQDKLLEILLYFTKFCDENGLGYVLAGGTCLGAVRHQGFIPWDDDVDVFMLREDYEKLQALWQEKADLSRYACVRSDDKVNIHHSATEIKDNNTTFINHHSENADIHQGLMIDVIPIDAVAPGKLGQLRQMVNCLVFCCFNFQRLPEHKSKLFYYATKLALALVPSFRMKYLLWRHCEKQIARYAGQNLPLVASFVEGATIMRQHFPREWFTNPGYLDFEGHRLKVPADTDSYLRISYGDYMQLPPEEERVYRHNAVFIDLKHSYKQYKGIKYCVEKKD